MYQLQLQQSAIILCDWACFIDANHGLFDALMLHLLAWCRPWTEREQYSGEQGSTHLLAWCRPWTEREQYSGEHGTSNPSCSIKVTHEVTTDHRSRQPVFFPQCACVDRHCLGPNGTTRDTSHEVGGWVAQHKEVSLDGSQCQKATYH